MKLQNINNATTIVTAKNFKLLFDPWITGNLYQDSWSPFPKQEINNEWFKNITHIYISHIDQDHWDIKTIKKISNKVKIIIPNIVFNKLIEKKLNDMGYKNTQMVNMGEWVKFNNNVSFYIVPPLNEMAQEFKYYKKFRNFQPIAIDTGLIIKDKISKTNHLILGDNSPYDIKSLKLHAQKIKLSTFWFPYNGYAQDYPLCYDDISFRDKKQISLKINQKREKKIIEAIKMLNPKYLIPHSSDFALNGPRRKEFYLVHNKEFLHKEMYSKRIEKLTKIKSLALYGKDSIIFNNGNILIEKKTTHSESIKMPKEIKLKFPKSNASKNSIKKDFEICIKTMHERAKRYKIPLTGVNKWVFQIEVNKIKLFADLETFEVFKKNPHKKKYLVKLKTSKNIIKCIMQKKIHLNNAVIGNYLTWERKPNIYNKFLWDMFSFFHLPLKKIKYSS